MQRRGLRRSRPLAGSRGARGRIARLAPRQTGGHPSAPATRHYHAAMPAPPSRALAQRLQALPKVLLHEHLDGGLRPATLLELLRARGLAAPAPDAAALAAWFDARAHAGSLTEYLRGFALTVAAMASPAALARVAFEAAEDARLDGCVLAEFRIAPLLFEPLGVPPEAAVEALLAGLRQSPLPSGLILCAMRDQPAAHSERVLRPGAALSRRGRDRLRPGGRRTGPSAVAPCRRLRDGARGRPADHLPCRRGRRGRARAGSGAPGCAPHRPRRAAGRCAGRAGRQRDARAARRGARQRRAPGAVPHQQRPHRRGRVAGGASDPAALAGRPERCRSIPTTG